MRSKALHYRMTMGIVLCAEVLSCSNCVAIMLSKAFDYAMIIRIVSYDEMFFMLLLRVNYAFESL